MEILGFILVVLIVVLRHLKQLMKKNKVIYYKTMLAYCLKCSKNTESKNPWAAKAKNGRIMALPNCAGFWQ